MSEQLIFSGEHGKAMFVGGETWVRSNRFDRLAAELAEALSAQRAELEAVNALGRQWGFGQGELDDDLAGCLSRRMESERAAREAAEARLKDAHAARDAILDSDADLFMECAALRSQLATVTAERDEAREGYHALDRNWDAHHGACMKVVANALGIQDDSLPAICEAIAARDAEIGKLRSVLDRTHVYADHARECDMWRLNRGDCTCGLFQLTKEVDAALTESEAANG